MKKSFIQATIRYGADALVKRFTFVFICVLFLTTLSLTAQTDFRPGYVIKSIGDTLYGELDYRGEKRMSEMCRYRQDKKGTVMNFLPGEILGYRFVDSKYYVSKLIDGKNVFLEYLINGKVSIYYLNEIMSEHYYIEKDGVGLVELPFQETKVINEEREYLQKSTKHIGVLKYFMSDAESVVPEIQKMTQPQHKNLIRLAQNYHQAVCDGEKCIVYEKKLPPFKLNPEIVGGFARFNPEVDFDLTGFSGYRPVSGILAHIWMPRENENLYLKTGLVCMFGNNSKVALYKIPLQLEYLYPHGVIRPRLSVGFDWLILNPACSAGVNIKLNKRLTLSANYDLNFFSKSATRLPDRILSNSFYTGLYFSL